MTSTGDFSPSFWIRRSSDRGLSRPCWGARLQDALKMSSLQQSEHTRVIPRVMKEPPCPTEGNVCLFFFLCQFTEFHSTVLWATFYLFMILHLLEALCLVTEGWLSCQLQRRTFWFAAMARWTQQVTFHFLHSKEILFSLTWHRRFMERILEAGDSNPESTFAVRHPNPPFVSLKSGVKDGEALKGRGFKPLHLYCKINLWILIFS